MVTVTKARHDQPTVDGLGLRCSTKADLQEAIARITPSLIEMRRDFHRYPELGFQEVRTSSRLAEFLEGLGLEVTRGVAQTGVVASLMGSRPGKTVLVRADIDVLPIHEDSGMAYSSQTPGVMHACGHDGHAAIAAHVAAVLTRFKNRFAGKVRFAFQPAELYRAQSLWWRRVCSRGSIRW